MDQLTPRKLLIAMYAAGRFVPLTGDEAGLPSLMQRAERFADLMLREFARMDREQSPTVTVGNAPWNRDAISRQRVGIASPEELAKDILALWKSDAEGWIDWPGGDCPVCVPIEVELRNGWKCNLYQPCQLRWQHLDFSGDIIRYRILP